MEWKKVYTKKKSEMKRKENKEKKIADPQKAFDSSTVKSSQ